MPSPFPGMDPYLEEPGLWPDFHNALAGEIRNALNKHLPQPYYAQLETRTELGILGEGTHRVVVPDVSVQRATRPLPPAEPGGGVAVEVEPRTEISPSIRIDVAIEPFELASVAIRDSTRGRELVTLIEIVSPSNKRPGPDRDRYLEKLDETLASTTSLVEIDLLRRGTRSWTPPRCDAGVLSFDPPADYLVVVNRAWQRIGVAGRFELEAFPIRLSDALPVVTIPLRETEPESSLDLKYCFRLAYEGGPYQRGAVDYDRLPTGAFSEAHEGWVRATLDAWHARRAPQPPN